eukprot:1160660-Pelagomonas_calceolata.AAC.9
MHGASALSILFFLIDVGSVFTAHVGLLFLSFSNNPQIHACRVTLKACQPCPQRSRVYKGLQWWPTARDSG